MPPKLIVAFSFLISFSLSFAETQWLEFNAGCPDNSKPLIHFGISDENFILFDIELRGLLAETLTVDSVDYLRFNKTPGTVPSDSIGRFLHWNQMSEICLLNTYFC